MRHRLLDRRVKELASYRPTPNRFRRGFPNPQGGAYRPARTMAPSFPALNGHVEDLQLSNASDLKSPKRKFESLFVFQSFGEG